jgi:broad specificity phosphatase PhoE
MPVRARLADVATNDRDWLHEIRSPSTWQDTPAEEVSRILEEARARPRDAWWDGLPDGESFIDFHERVTTGLDLELREIGVTRTEDRLWRVPDDAPERLLMIAHAGTNSVVLGSLLGLQPEPWEWERFASDHASVTVLRSTRIAGRHIFSLQGFSDVSHLDPRDVTA